MRKDLLENAEQRNWSVICTLGLSMENRPRDGTELKEKCQGGARMSVFGMIRICEWNLTEVRWLSTKIFFNHNSLPGVTFLLKEVRGWGVGHLRWAWGEEEKAEPLTETPSQGVRQGEPPGGPTWGSVNASHEQGSMKLKGEMRPDSGLSTRKRSWFTKCGCLQNAVGFLLHSCFNPRRGLTAKMMRSTLRGDPGPIRAFPTSYSQPTEHCRAYHG